MPSCTPATKTASRPCPAGCTITTTTVPTPLWEAEAPCKPSTTSQGTAPRGTFFGKLDAQTFSRLLGAGEFTLGASLLLPIVAPALAGLGLAGFSAGSAEPANAEDA